MDLNSITLSSDSATDSRTFDLIGCNFKCSKYFSMGIKCQNFNNSLMKIVNQEFVPSAVDSDFIALNAGTLRVRNDDNVTLEN